MVKSEIGPPRNRALERERKGIPTLPGPIQETLSYPELQRVPCAMGLAVAACGVVCVGCNHGEVPEEARRTRSS